MCLQVIADPTETLCEHQFCRKCIEGWLELHNACPSCNETTQLSTLRAPSRIFRNMWYSSMNWSSNVNGAKILLHLVILKLISRAAIWLPCPAQMWIAKQYCNGKCSSSTSKSALKELLFVSTVSHKCLLMALWVTSCRVVLCHCHASLLSVVRWCKGSLWTITFELAQTEW